MNIDERLEALAQTVELLASIQKATEKKMEIYMVRMMQAITRVANVTAVHELRLADHGERLSDLESQ